VELPPGLSDAMHFSFRQPSYYLQCHTALQWFMAAQHRDMDLS